MPMAVVATRQYLPMAAGACFAALVAAASRTARADGTFAFPVAGELLGPPTAGWPVLAGWPEVASSTATAAAAATSGRLSPYHRQCGRRCPRAERSERGTLASPENSRARAAAVTSLVGGGACGSS